MPFLGLRKYVILLRSADFSNAWLHKCHGHSFRRTSVREERVMFFSWCLSLCQRIYSEARNLLSNLLKRNSTRHFLFQEDNLIYQTYLLLLIELLNSLCLVLLLLICSSSSTLFTQVDSIPSIISLLHDSSLYNEPKPTQRRKQNLKTFDDVQNGTLYSFFHIQ